MTNTGLAFSQAGGVGVDIDDVGVDDVTDDDQHWHKSVLPPSLPPAIARTSGSHK